MVFMFIFRYKEGKIIELTGGYMKLLLTTLMMMSFSVQVWACSCGAWDAQQVMDHADGVYIAIPTQNSRAVLPHWPLPRRPRLGGFHKTPMKIVKTYKGTNTDELNIYHDPQIGTSCEFDFQGMSGVYVVITFKHLGQEFTDSCSSAVISPNNSMVTNFLNNL